jgi:pimeloyl-ACP methyl ester carboxylesterase
MTDLVLEDGRTLRYWDSGVASELTLLWHHGSPQTGAPLEPLERAAEARGIRLLSYGRAGYGGSTAVVDRDVASAAGDVRAIVDALGIDRFAAMGASGGGPHALACAALLPERVVAAVSIAGLAPYGEPGWFSGMADEGGLRAALRGREARELFEQTAEFDENSFSSRDYAALAGAWSSLGDDVQAASAFGSGGLVADDLAFVKPWGFDPREMSAPVLLVHGRDDRVVPSSHSDRLLEVLPHAELWVRPHDGHISVLDAIPVAMDWIVDRW